MSPTPWCDNVFCFLLVRSTWKALGTLAYTCTHKNTSTCSTMHKIHHSFQKHLTAIESSQGGKHVAALTAHLHPMWKGQEQTILTPKYTAPSSDSHLVHSSLLSLWTHEQRDVSMRPRNQPCGSIAHIKRVTNCQRKPSPCHSNKK